MKRFIDTEIFNKKWFRKLPGDLKSLWIYMICNCDIAGILSIDYELISFHIGVKISKKDIDDNFAMKISWLEDDKIFLKDFVLFQQKINVLDELNPQNNCHKGIIKILQKYKIISPSLGASLGLASPIGKGIGKGKGKGNRENVDNSDALRRAKDFVNRFVKELAESGKYIYMTNEEYNYAVKLFKADRYSFRTGTCQPKYLRKQWVDKLESIFESEDMNASKKID